MMEDSATENERMITEPLLDEVDGPKKGGLRTIPFILANESFEQVASYGLQPNMILYLTREYHLEMTTGSNILFFWSAATNFMPLLGAIVADSFLGRYRTILVGCLFNLVGMALLLLTTIIPELRPPPCNEPNFLCGSATSLQLLFLRSSFGLMSVGAGGIRSSSLAFGADQLKRGGSQKNSWVLESYFSWYYAACTLSILVALTSIVYVQDNMGWQIGFGIPFFLMFLSTLSFTLASSFYVKLKCKSSLIIELVQVAVASYRRRHIELSSESSNMLYHHKKGSAILPSEKLRFLNNACIIIDPDKDLAADGRAADPWSLCTVDQVEELKALLKVLPLWSTGMIMSVNISQGSFGVLQAKSVNRKIGSSFEIPAGSFGTFTVASIIICIVFYDRILLPSASRIMGRPVHLSTKQRMGIGIVMSILSMIVTAAVETARRSLAIKEGYSDNPEAVLDLSALWLIPQACLAGFAEAFNAVAQNEFFYSEFPRSMSSIASSLVLLGISLANLLASFLMSTIDKFTKSGGKESWISSNINKGHYDYYFWILAGLSVLNMIYFLICSRVYGPTKEDLQENCSRGNGPIKEDLEEDCSRAYGPCKDDLE